MPVLFQFPTTFPGALAAAILVDDPKVAMIRAQHRVNCHNAGWLAELSGLGGIFRLSTVRIAIAAIDNPTAARVASRRCSASTVTDVDTPSSITMPGVHSIANMK